MTERGDLDSTATTGLAATAESVDVDDDARVREAVALIDERLGVLVERELVSATEVTDLLLDVRALITVPA
jgi:hypothetical protein